MGQMLLSKRISLVKSSTQTALKAARFKVVMAYCVPITKYHAS
jgi:hypothetical protein